VTVDASLCIEGCTLCVYIRPPGDQGGGTEGRRTLERLAGDVRAYARRAARASAAQAGV